MGLFDWLGNKAKNTTKKAGNYTRKVVAADEIEKSGKYIGDLVKGLGKTEGRSETFENAYERLGLDDESLKETYKFYMDRFLIFSFFTGLGIVALFYFIVTSFLTALACIGFLAICISQLFNSSFRMFQIRRRELCSVGVWLRNSDEWWPKPLQVRSSSSRSSNKNLTVRNKNNTSIERRRKK